MAGHGELGEPRALAGKPANPAWRSGAGLAGFVRGVLTEPGGANPAVQSRCAGFLRGVLVAFWAWVLVRVETLVGLALIVGLFTGIAAFFGGFMTFNYLLAGTVSINPLYFVIATWLALAWKGAGGQGPDRWVPSVLGTPWQPGPAFQHRH